MVTVSTFKFRSTVSVVNHRYILQREGCLVHDRPFFAFFFKRADAQISAIVLLVYSLSFSIGLVQDCFIVHDDVANIRHAAAAHLHRVAIYNFVLAVVWREMVAN